MPQRSGEPATAKCSTIQNSAAAAMLVIAGPNASSISVSRYCRPPPARLCCVATTSGATLMDWHVLLVFTLTMAVFAIAPGPAVLLVVSHGVKSGWGASLKAAIGVQAGNGIYFLL